MSPDRQILKVETFACEGSSGTALNRPRILLRIFNNGEVELNCTAPRGVNFGTQSQSDVIFYCTADPIQREGKEIDDVVREMGDNVSRMIEEKRVQYGKNYLSRYFTECPFLNKPITSKVPSEVYCILG